MQIKSKSLKVMLGRQRGFSLLEALLSIVIILAAGLGVVELYISADKKNKAETVQKIVQQAASAMSQLLSTDYNATDLATKDVVNSGLIASTYINTDKTGIIGPYGDITVKQINGSSAEYYITNAKNIPGDQAINICQNMFTSAAVYAGVDAPATINLASKSAVSYCQTTFAGGSSVKFAMSFAFPREDFVSSSS